jgi:hypothetical protein
MTKNTTPTACVRMTGPDEQMDHRPGSYEPANPLPIKCPHCTFPDLNFVPQPYFLTKGVSSPAETANAHFGNFFVRERLKRILELAVPGACAFYPTIERKGNKPAPWWLAVPQRTLEIPVPKPTPPFCPKCYEPKLWAFAMGPVWAEMCHYDTGGVDVFKSLAWYSQQTAEDEYAETNRFRKEDALPPLPWSNWGVEPPPHAERWTRRMLGRNLYFSVRLEQLLKRAKIKGHLVRLLDFKQVQPSAADEAWIAEKLHFLADASLAKAGKLPGTASSSATRTWFKQFLKRHAKRGLKPPAFASLERKHGLVLPQDYKELISVAGSKAFKDACGMEGSTTTILSAQRLDFLNYRRGKLPFLGGEDVQIDGVMFAEVDNGDCFVFDVSAKAEDYPVYWHKHEENELELFAPNFTECIKRFAQRN